MLPSRDATVIKAGAIGLKVDPEADVYIPPSIKHEVGADALALLAKTGILDERKNALVIDYGTNAEMALKADDTIYTGSAAAGPAIEGQRIEKGMLAAPGAICDINADDEGWVCYVLNESLIPIQGDTINPLTGSEIRIGTMHKKAVRITGTGVIALVEEGMRCGVISPPKIVSQQRVLHLQDGIYFTETY